MQKAVEAGATLCTHLGNGIQNYIHRHNNPIWFSLAEKRLSVSVIADGHHLPPPILKVISACKPSNNIFLVSDATQFMGMKPGVYEEFGSSVELKGDGKLCLKGTPYLAGSASSLLDCIPIWQKHTASSWDKCFKSASSVPAKLLGVKCLPSVYVLVQKQTLCV
jgi:N-acetylglucosamine-6-phosphate deacetylase